MSCLVVFLCVRLCCWHKTWAETECFMRKICDQSCMADQVVSGRVVSGFQPIKNPKIVQKLMDKSLRKQKNKISEEAETE